MSTSPKIAIVTPVFPPYRGGIGNVAYNQARVLGACPPERRERGADVTVFSPAYTHTPPTPPRRGGDCKKNPLLFEEGEGGGVRDFTLELLKPFIQYGNAAWVPGLGKRLKDFQVVILQYPFFGGMRAVYRAKKKYGFKLILNYNMDVVGRGFKGLVFWYATRFFLPRIIKAADVVLASSEDYARHSALGRFWDPSNPKFQIMPNGVDINKFAFSDAPRERMILFVGGLDKAHYFKGVEYLIKATRIVKGSEGEEKGVKGGEGTVAVIVGKGQLAEEYKKLAQDLGVGDMVEFRGGVSDEELVKLYQKAMVTILSSIDQSEAFGIVLVESMSCGTPVIASDLPGVRSVFENGVSGFTVLPRNVESLAERIQYALDNSEKMREMGRAGRRLVEERYDWERIGGGLQRMVVQNYGISVVR